MNHRFSACLCRLLAPLRHALTPLQQRTHSSQTLSCHHHRFSPSVCWVTKHGTSSRLLALFHQHRFRPNLLLLIETAGRYVLERRAKKPKLGVMLPRPSLLLAPTELRTSKTSKEALSTGASYNETLCRASKAQCMRYGIAACVWILTVPTPSLQTARCTQSQRQLWAASFARSRLPATACCADCQPGAGQQRRVQGATC